MQHLIPNRLKKRKLRDENLLMSLFIRKTNKDIIMHNQFILKSLLLDINNQNILRLIVIQFITYHVESAVSPSHRFVSKFIVALEYSYNIVRHTRSISGKAGYI